MKINLIKSFYIKVWVSLLLINNGNPIFAQQPKENITPKECHTKRTLIDLFTTHGSLVREFIIATFANIPNKSVIQKSLDKNRDEIANLLNQYYKNSGNEFKQLFAQHIKLDGKFAEAVKANDQKTAKIVEAQLKENAQQLGDFFENLNPDNWKSVDMTNMMLKHIELTSGEVKAQAKKDWNADREYADKNKAELTNMAIELTHGLVNQFPNKFNK